MDLKVNGVVKHDGVWYRPGDVIKDIKPDDAKRLIDSGIAETVEEPSAKGKGSGKKDKEPDEDGW